MSRAAVICEFNPFHNGHKFLLEKIKEQYADETVCIMSGGFVQRGDIAITDKYERAEAALRNGADLVAELPTVYAVAPAQIFAEAGVRLAYELGCDTLCFGTENSIKELYGALKTLDATDTQAQTAKKMRDGSYYPRALAEAVGEPYASVIAQPNNILALEYIRACRQYGITPVALPRVGTAHDSDRVSGGFASATKIRELILSGDDYRPYTPMRIDRPASLSGIEAAILYRLKTAGVRELAMLPDVSEGLEHRIKAAALQNYSYEEILSACKTKRYTMARLRRILLSALLGITAEYRTAPVPYVRVLGFCRDKRRLITSRSLPLIVDVRRGYDALDEAAKEIFDVDLRAADAMNIARKTIVNEFSHGVVMIP